MFDYLVKLVRVGVSFLIIWIGLGVGFTNYKQAIKGQFPEHPSDKKIFWLTIIIGAGMFVLGLWLMGLSLDMKG